MTIPRIEPNTVHRLTAEQAEAAIKRAERGAKFYAHASVAMERQDGSRVEVLRAVRLTGHDALELVRDARGGDFLWLVNRYVRDGHIYYWLG